MVSTTATRLWQWAAKVWPPAHLYNVGTQTWSVGPAVEQRVSRAASFQRANDFLVIGGHNGVSKLDTIYVYDGSDWVKANTTLSAPVVNACVTEYRAGDMG